VEFGFWLWKPGIGEYRLICSSATRAKDVDTLTARAGALVYA
jgi:hypothetical protein